MRHWITAVFIAGCLILANGCSKNISRATAAIVLSVKGSVSFGSADRNNFEPVTIKSIIHDDGTVRSADDASVDLALIPGAFARVAGKSEIKIDELRIVKDGNETADAMQGRIARIRLVRGKIIVLFSPGDQTKSQFAIKAQQLTVKPDFDCLFSIQTDGTATRVTCARGQVDVSAEAQPPITIPAGYFEQWPAASTKPIAAADNADAQVDITESLEAGAQLLEQAVRWQGRRPL